MDKKAETAGQQMTHFDGITYEIMVGQLAKKGVDLLAELTPEKVEAWHHASCVCGEAGELFDNVKKWIVYNKAYGPKDRANAVEEFGDIEFYLEGLRQVLGITREETLEANMNKLHERYPGFGYSNQHAQERKDKK